MASQPQPRPLARMASQPQPRSYVRKCVVLHDWCLERAEEGKIRIAGLSETPQMRTGASSSRGTRNTPAREFKCEVARRYDSDTIETANGHLVRIGGVLNSSRMRENGFSDKVCEAFQFGFPIEWEKRANSSMEQTDGHSHKPSESAATVKYFMELFSSDSFIKSKQYAFMENYYLLFGRPTSNTDGPPTQMSSYSLNGNTGNDEKSMSKVAASEGLGNERMNMLEGTLTPPRETCHFVQEDDQRGTLQIDGIEQEIAGRSISSVLAKQSTGSTCSYSKEDGNRLVPRKIALVGKECHMSRASHGQEEQDAAIQHENVQSCLSQQEMVTVSSHMNRISSDLGQRETPKCGETSVNQRMGDASKVPAEGMTPQFVAVRASEDKTVRKLRNGKVIGGLSSAPMKSGNKRKRAQQKTSNDKKVPNEGVTPTADRTSHENVHQSPLTRSKAKALSISTPESMKRSRSGRLIVPRLDPGSQNIIYGPDGDISGIKNMCNDAVYVLAAEINSEPSSKRRKRAARLPE